MYEVFGPELISTPFPLSLTRQPSQSADDGFAPGNSWNGGEFYGPTDRNSLVLLERYFSQYPSDADTVSLNIKGCMNFDLGRIDGSARNTRRSLDGCIAQLKGRKKLDLFEFGRRDPAVPMEETFGLIDREYV